LVRPHVNPLRAELDALLAEYRRDLLPKLARLEEHLAAGRLAELTRELHTLAGSAGTFGLLRVGEAALAAETHLNSCGATLKGAQRAELERLLAQLRHAAGIGGS
jgi:HPt (histidine-containing phosphotransfer) domain-containing protein